MSSNPTKSQAINAETTKNPKDGSDWLGGPQNGNETGNSTEGAYSLGGWSGSIQEDWNSGHPGGESAGRVGTGNIAGNVESDYTKHRFYETPGNGGNGGNGAVTQNGSETPSEGYFIPRHRNETPGEAYGSGSSSGFLPENAKNPKEGSDWLGGPQNGSETPGKSTEGAYQQNGQSWLGGPQNGNETTSKSTYQQNGQSDTVGTENVESDYTKHR